MRPAIKQNIMSKYIDAEKLKAKLRRQKRELELSIQSQGDYGQSCQIVAYENILSLITSLQQEQPEVDLEKFTEKVKTFQARYKYPESISIKGAMAFMARMFYQYPNTARQWYDSLPKATMDDARKEE